ncbi:hypothetical protein LTR62_002267 [Meristemomyces frigidus]|uniref:RRM domain-containing protein n=1 Tax=Meristemomyces frigidus TaxID=1508187 RepID=A0AAN7YS98_9PEZI|nr:hypothetical protein LTR62_002267 [Meristemomyces frigidus]
MSSNARSNTGSNVTDRTLSRNQITLPTITNHEAGHRYVPPQKRPFVHPEIKRPKSAMSNESIISQAEEGGVSLNDLENGRYGHDPGSFIGMFGPQSPRSEHNLRAILSMGKTGSGSSGTGMSMRGVGSQAESERSDSRFDSRRDGHQGAFVVKNQNTQSGSGLKNPEAASFQPSFGQGGPKHGSNVQINVRRPDPQTPRFIPPPPPRTSLSILPPPHGSMPILPRPRDSLPNFGAIGTPFPPSGLHDYSIVDSNASFDPVIPGGDRRAKELAFLIQAGWADPGDDQRNIIGRRAHVFSTNNHTKNNIAAPPPRQVLCTIDAELDPTYLSELTITRDANTNGNAAAYYNVSIKPMPRFFLFACRGIKPTIEELFDNLPFIEPCRVAAASSAGVIRIRNIPYSTPRSEITAFVSRNAQVVSQPPGSPYFATHIIMERNTGKTMDAFIEFTRPWEAKKIVETFSKRLQGGHPARIGTRVVEVELSSQEDLMGELFPRAKKVIWKGSTPKVLTNREMYYEGILSAGFTGFLSTEEIVMTVKHAETPSCSPFAARAIIRVYESLISTIHKYPWHAHECIYMTERRLLFDCCMSLSNVLVHSLSHGNQNQIENTKPTTATLQELTVAVLTCPGFSENMKYNYIEQLRTGGWEGMANGRGMNLKFGGVTPLAGVWPFLILARDPGVQEPLVKYFAELLRDANGMGGRVLSLAEQHSMRTSGSDTPHDSATAQGPFGRMKFDYGNAKTIHDVAQTELNTIETLLRKVLPSSRRASQD